MVHPGSDWIECTGFSLFAVSSLTCAILYMFLLYIQLKKHGVRNWETYKKYKTLVYFSAIVQLILIFIDNLIEPHSIGWMANTMITAIIALLRQCTANLLFHYFKKRTVKLITEDKVKRLQLLQKFQIGLSICCFTAMCAAFAIKIDEIANAEDDH